MAGESARVSNGTTARGSTHRTRGLASDAASREYRPFTEQRSLYASCPDVADEPRLLREARRFSSVYPRLTPVIREGELIVGARLRGTTEPGFDFTADGGSWYLDYFAANTPADNAAVRAMGERGLVSPQGSFNRKVMDCAGYIRTGSLALIERARGLLETREGAARCEELARAATLERAEELTEIARICRKVPAYPAETFHEALQCLWFAYMVAGCAPSWPWEGASCRST